MDVELTKNEKRVVDLVHTHVRVLKEQERRRNGTTKKSRKEFEGLIKEISKELDVDYKKVLRIHYLI